MLAWTSLYPFTFLKLNSTLWRCCSQIASDYMISCINPLRLVSAPPPPPLPAPPPLSQALVLIASLVNLTRGTQGCPKIISFDKSKWHPNFLTSLFSTFFFSAALHLYIFTTPLAGKSHSLFPSVISPRILLPLSFSLQFFHLPLINANYSYQRVFGTSLLTLFGVSLVLRRRERLITSIATPVLLPSPLNSQHLHFSFTVASLSNIFVRSRRDWEKKCRIGIRQGDLEMIRCSNGNDIETKRNEASIIRHFLYRSKSNKLIPKLWKIEAKRT